MLLSRTYTPFSTITQVHSLCNIHQLHICNFKDSNEHITLASLSCSVHIDLKFTMKHFIYPNCQSIILYVRFGIGNFRCHIHQLSIQSLKIDIKLSFLRIQCAQSNVHIDLMFTMKHLFYHLMFGCCKEVNISPYVLKVLTLIAHTTPWNVQALISYIAPHQINFLHI